MRYIVRSVDGDEYGPFSRRELLDLVRDRRLGPGDFVRRETGRTWSPFERIAGLADTEPAAASDSPEDPGRSLRIEPAPEVLEAAGTETETDEDDSETPTTPPQQRQPQKPR